MYLRLTIIIYMYTTYINDLIHVHVVALLINAWVYMYTYIKLSVWNIQYIANACVQLNEGSMGNIST